MKKIYILAAIALVAGVSCTKQVPADNNSPDVPISFSPFALRNATKTAGHYGEVGINYNTNESFSAWAYFTKAGKATVNPQTNTDATLGSPFFGTNTAGEQCDYNSTDKYWAPTTTYYWPKAGYLHFHALSPYDIENGSISHSWANGFTITNYVAKTYVDSDTGDDQTADNQIDLLYSDFVFDQQRSSFTPQTGMPYDDDNNQTGASGTGLSDYAYNGVNITFNHALAAVRFKAKTAENYLTGKQQHKFIIRKIEILKAYNTGKFNENRATTADNAFQVLPSSGTVIGKTSGNVQGTDLTPYWDTFSNETTIVPYDATASTATGVEASYVATYDPTSATPAPIGTLAIVLPQALDHDPGATTPDKVQIRVTYDYWFSNDSGTNWTKYEVSAGTGLESILDIAGFEGKYNYTTSTPTPDYTVNNWLINHKYTYVLNFKLDSIIFDPMVVGWVEVENIGVDLPFQN